MKRKRTALYSIQNWEFETQRVDKHPHSLSFWPIRNRIQGNLLTRFAYDGVPVAPMFFSWLLFFPFNPVVSGIKFLLLTA